jgi:large subunit ribosomal protein L24
MARHVRKGDKVMVVSGSHKGKTGTITRVISGADAGSERVVIKGLNLRTKHLRPTRTAPQGGIITREAPLHISNVMPVDSQGKPTRVRFVSKPDGSKVRVAATTGEELGEVRSAGAKEGVKRQPHARPTTKAPKAPKAKAPAAAKSAPKSTEKKTTKKTAKA